MSVKSYSGDIRYPLAIVALVVAGFLLDAGVGVVINSYVESGSTWLPTVGGIGSTISLYLFVVNTITFVLIPVLAFYLGHKHGQQTR